MLRMPRIASTIAVVLASLAMTTTAMAAGPQGPKLVPFHATAAGTYQAQVLPPNVIITATAEGQATHLGRFEVIIRNTVTGLPTPAPGCVTSSTEIFTATLVAANGDTITLEGTGTGCQTPPTVAVVDVATVTGGTGRFEGASGSVTVTTAVNQTDRTEVVTFEGTLSTPGSTK
jgi:hypothetical protein